MTSFQFTVNEQPVTDKEAVALLKAASYGGSSPHQIELTKLFNIKKLDTRYLFKQAVETQNQELATLAWKLSVSMGGVKEETTKRKYKRGVSHKIETKNLNEDIVISVVCTNVACWSVGVALLLYALNERFHPGVTLKEICIDYVNQAWHKFDVVENSILFKGFHKEETNLGFVWSPILYTKGTGQDSYPQSTLYKCAREGMKWAKEHGLIDIETCISYGSDGGEDTPQTAMTQRKYYKLSSTEFGTSVFNKWGDSIDLVNRYFASNLK